VPGATERYVAKLAATPSVGRPDAVILDLEDGVAHADLVKARERVRTLLSHAGAPTSYLAPVMAVRSHAVPDPEFGRDLEALGPGPSTLLLPKVGSADEVEEALIALQHAGLSHVGLGVIVESAGGLENLPAILRAGVGRASSVKTAVVAVAFGAEDFAADVGLPPIVAEPASPVSQHGSAAAGRLTVLDAARARIVIAAAAARVAWRIDTPVLQLRSTALVEAEARRSRKMGFSGKFCIHPAHVEPLHRGFEPSASEVAWAQAVLASGAAAGEGVGEGVGEVKGATAKVGQMVDEAVSRQARDILAARRDTTETSD